MKRTMRSQAGYSLAEMLVVVAIIGMLALVMVPNFMNFYQSNKMKSSMRNFTTDLRSARQLSISQGKQTLVTYATGPTARSYDIWMGDKPFGSMIWTAQTGPASNPPRPTKTLDNIVYFPQDTGSPATLQTFPSTAPPCTVPPAVTCSGPPFNLTSTKFVVFSPDGTAQLQSGFTNGTITIKTDLNKLPKSSYTITISPSGRVLAQ
jgi:prepilin-type N-terminal cleavage/methylation domain-containing protein